MMAHTFIAITIPQNIHQLLPFSINYTKNLKTHDLIHLKDNIFLHYEAEVIVSEYGVVNNYTRVLPGIIQAFNEEYIYTSDDIYLYVYEIDTLVLYYMANIFCQSHYAITEKGIHFNTEMFKKDLILHDNQFFQELRFLFFVDKIPYPRHVLEKYFYSKKILEPISENEISISVKFSDLLIFLRKDCLLSLYSSFINQQLSVSNEIFLDVKYSDFLTMNILTLEYLDSDLLPYKIKELFYK